MHTGVLDQNWIRNFYRPIGYPIGPPSKLYEDKEATIKRVLAERITTQLIPLNVRVTGLHELDPKKIQMVDTRYIMQLADLNSKPHGGKILRDLIYRVIGVCFYPPPVSEYHKILLLDRFHGTSHINNSHRKNNEMKSAIFV